MHRTLAVSCLVALSACGGDNVGKPTPVPRASATPPPPLTDSPVFLDGVTGAGVPAQIAPESPARGVPVTVTAPGYLVRHQLFTGAPFHLWPATEDYVRELAYGEWSDGVLRMSKWTRGFVVTLEGGLATNSGAVAKTREAIAEVQRVTGLPVTLGTNGSVVIKIEPRLLQTSDAVGEARLNYQGATVVGATLAFVSFDELTGISRVSYPNTLLHEMGHALGLGHSTDPRDVMSTVEGPGWTAPGYQAGEAATLRMMYLHRTAGTVFPDRDPGVAASSSARPLRTVIRD